jgi:hypothetical protein
MKNLNINSAKAQDNAYQPNLKSPSSPQLFTPSYKSNYELDIPRTKLPKNNGYNLKVPLSSTQRPIMSSGEKVIDPSKIHPIHINKEVPLDYIKNYSIKQNVKKTNGADSFEQLGFNDSYRRDPYFNPHLEYNMRKVPQRYVMNGSTEARSDFSNSQYSNRSEINHQSMLRNKV